MTLYIHVAGFYNITGFWNGNEETQCIFMKRGKEAPKPDDNGFTGHRHDASKEWDGGLDDVIPYLDF
jgi:hypothetical protein